MLTKKWEKTEDFRFVSTEEKIVLPWYIIHYDSYFKRVWNAIISILLIYTATIMPYRVAFEETIYFDAWTCLELVIDSIFFIDVFVNSLSSTQLEDGTVIKDFKTIFKNYAKGWMILDIIACFPFSLLDYMLGNEGE